MGNGERGTIFRQSLRDFPCPVTLGKYTPSFGLHRFKQGLHFLPLCDEGFTLRGDRRRLLYKGRRRSHRFTILGDTSFEYDCILEHEPESNIITLLLEGAEYFDFFRQPDFVKNPFLKGSYAVYKKKTLLGEGTGKLCHINRPLIIDARGRRVWGELAVVSNVLRITIPEWFLSGAKYPVVVDPVVGTSTVGSQYKYYNTEYDEWDKYMISEALAVNRYLLPENMCGNATAYIYFFRDVLYKNKWYSSSVYIRPCIFSENNNKPFERLSANEQQLGYELIEIEYDGWYPATFSANREINGGNYIWFGVSAGDFLPRFDYGAKCYMSNNEDDNYPEYRVPDFFPLNNPYIFTENILNDNIIISMYFNYTPMQHYIRTLIQGVRLSDNRKIIGNYQRKTLHTVQAGTTIKKLQTFCRIMVEMIQCRDNISYPILFIRKTDDNINVLDTLSHWEAFFRGISEKVNIDSGLKSGWVFLVKISDTVNAAGVVFRGLLLVVRIVTKVFIRDYLLGRFLKAREELILKSAVYREIILDSKIN